MRRKSLNKEVVVNGTRPCRNREHMEQLYLHEKHTADLWRRMNENTKLRRAVAGGIKFDK